MYKAVFVYMKAAKKAPAPIRAPAAPTLTLAAEPVEEAVAEEPDAELPDPPEVEDARVEVLELPREEDPLEEPLEPDDEAEPAAPAPEEPVEEEPEPVAATTAALRT